MSAGCYGEKPGGWNTIILATMYHNKQNYSNIHKLLQAFSQDGCLCLGAAARIINSFLTTQKPNWLGTADPAVANM